jgi:hypothetical protein
MITTLYDIAQELAIKKDDTTDKHLTKYLLFGREAIKELNLTQSLNVKSVLLEIDKETMTVKLPNDYIEYTRVGILINGRILELDYDNRIYPYQKPLDLCCNGEDKQTPEQRFKNDCGCLLDGVDLPYNYNYAWHNIGHGQSLVTHYTTPAYYGTKFFRVHDGHIYLNSICPIENSFIVLEYKTTGVDEKQTIVPELYKEAVSAYIDWKTSLYKEPQMARVFEREYQRQYKIISNIKNSSTLLAILRAVRSTKAQGIIKY